MAQAKITTADGITVEVHGSPEEVTTIVERLRVTGGSTTSAAESRKAQSPKQRPGKVQITDLLEEMRREEFFKAPRGLGAVRQKLADMGHHYPLTSLSGTMQSEARKHRLRRFKQGGKYVYVQ